jgi:hypothetical protein
MTIMKISLFWSTLFHHLKIRTRVHWPVTIQVAFTRKNNFGKEDRELQWVQAQRTLHGLHPVQKESQGFKHHDSEHHNANKIAEQAKRRAEIARYDYIQSPRCTDYFIILPAFF